MHYQSPWLEFNKPAWHSLKTDISCDVAIVGAGISGVSTLYYILTNTDRNAILVEKSTIASGATGNNAGIATAHFERPITELVEEFGKEQTQKLFSELDEAMELVYEIHEEIGLMDNITLFPFAAFGISSIDLLTGFIQDTKIHNEFGRATWQFIVSESVNIPPELTPLVKFVPAKTVLKRLKSQDTRYIAAAIREPLKGARMNSARFCYAMLTYLETKFPDRFSIYEQTEITTIDLFEESQTLQTPNGIITSRDVILCTNGYTDFAINADQKPITKLQSRIRSREGYLAAFPSPSPEVYALGFLNEAEQDTPYWYISNAPINTTNYTMIGGPEFFIERKVDEKWGPHSLSLMKNFLKVTLNQTPITFPYFWHGTMAYTENGLRWVGEDPDHPHLWYNLGCNGIGIVPAIAAAVKIAQSI